MKTYQLIIPTRNNTFISLRLQWGNGKYGLGFNHHLFQVKAIFVQGLFVLLFVGLVYKLFDAEQVIYVDHIYYGTEKDKSTAVSEQTDQLTPTTSVVKTASVAVPAPMKGNDIIGWQLKHLGNFNPTDLKSSDEFIAKRQLLITQYLLQNNASSVHRLNEKAILQLHGQLSALYVSHILMQLNAPNESVSFFTDTKELHKIETALMEQLKYHIPASVILAQAAMETAFGQTVVANNYFGVKALNQKGEPSNVVAYYTQDEVVANLAQIKSQEKVQIKGATYYKCIITKEVQRYTTPWTSFREHSLSIRSNPELAPLFKKGKDYKAWSIALGALQGSQPVTSKTLYASIMNEIIEKYHLHLLDM